MQHDYEVAKVSLVFAGLSQTAYSIWSVDFLGVSNLLLFLVFANVLLDAHFGVQKSILISQKELKVAMKFPDNSPDRRMFIRKSERNKFQAKKLYYTFFKCASLAFYLYFAKNLLEVQDGTGTLAEIIGFASGVVTKAPIAIFWYYDFKSIGNNTAYIYGKKAPIFVIVEKMFDPRLKAFFDDPEYDKKTTSDQIGNYLSEYDDAEKEEILNNK